MVGAGHLIFEFPDRYAVTVLYFTAAVGLLRAASSSQKVRTSKSLVALLHRATERAVKDDHDDVTHHQELVVEFVVIVRHLSFARA
ncbi:hypothetical protein L209DRAFT_747345 [Thermothelomyces heterothallicus CBS 203.75]